jgi:hypothetical protein
MPTIDELTAQVKRLSKELDRRVARHRAIEPYYENDRDDLVLPPAITQARLTKVYRYLMPVAEAPWGSLVVDSKLDRLEVSGIQDDDEDVANAVWDVWQDCYMDSESKLAHSSALLDGRAFATVWPDPDTGKPDIALDDCTQMIVQYAEGSRHKRVAALRRWQEGGDYVSDANYNPGTMFSSETTYAGGQKFATLYRPEGIYKFRGATKQEIATGLAGGSEWLPRYVDSESWPLENLLAPEVPVVELAVNRRLKPGPFPHARGEFAHCTGLIDRINLLTFLGLVVAFWQGFPLRGVIGDKIRREVLKDDDGNVILDPSTGKEATAVKAPFDAHPDAIWQIENPEAKIQQFDAADRKNLSVFAELDQLAVITKTPRHYFPLEQGMSNLSADAIVASEGGMLAAVTGHKSTLGEGWEEVLRLAGRLLDKPVQLSQKAEMEWKKHDSRSLAESADAFVKLTGSGGGSGLPWMAAAELCLNVSDSQLKRWESEQATNPLMQLVAQARQPVPIGEPTQNGNTPPVPAPS